MATIVDDDLPATPEDPPGGPGAPDTTAPQTTIDSGPRKKSRKKKATFAFSSSEPGSTFQCALDKAAFAACRSPRTVRVKEGKHKFLVRAIDRTGNVDRSPATVSWKFKKKRERR